MQRNILNSLIIGSIAVVAAVLVLSDRAMNPVRVPYMDDFAYYSGPTLRDDVQFLLSAPGLAWAAMLAGLVMLVWMNCGPMLAQSWRRRLHDRRRFGWPAG